MFTDIMSIISLVFSTASTLIVGFMTYKVGKYSNLEAIHKYQKQITPFELQFKTKEWFLKLIENDEFNNYDENSKTIMIAWWNKLNKEESPKQVKVATRTSRTGRGTISRVPILPTDDIVRAGTPVEVIIPNSEINNKCLEELREQYSVDVDAAQISTKQAKKVELDFDDLLTANIEIKED